MLLKWLTGAYGVDAYAFINQLSGHWSRGLTGTDLVVFQALTDHQSRK